MRREFWGSLRSQLNVGSIWQDILFYIILLLLLLLIIIQLLWSGFIRRVKAKAV
jgi:hypothetical protein